ncbi:MAG: glycosyltransferase family 2 protein, partial [Pseudomonadota bacterium]
MNAPQDPRGRSPARHGCPPRGEQPAVSVILPTYDRAACLPHAIHSVLAQDFGPVEIIVVDDGSRDATREVVAAFGARVIY